MSYMKKKINSLEVLWKVKGKSKCYDENIHLNGNPLQYSCLENPMDRGVWKATVHGVARVRHDLATKPPHLNNQCLYGTDLVNFSCLDVEAVVYWD